MDPNDPTGQLGATLTPQPTLGAPDPGLKQEWDGWLQNPANRAGLMTFGLQMMSGGWGGFGQNLALSVGKGVEAAAETESQNYERQTAEQTRAENRSDRQSARAESADLRRQALEDRKAERAARDEERKSAQSERQLASLMRLEATLAKQESDLSANAALLGEAPDEATAARLSQLKARRESVAARIEALDAAAGGVGAGTGTSVNMPTADAPVASEGAGLSGKATSGNVPSTEGAQVDPGAIEFATKYADKLSPILTRPDADAQLKKAGVPYTAEQLRRARQERNVQQTTPVVPNVVDVIRGLVGY
jgi:flagellar biosynthesis GTPase FlhF